MSQLSRRCRYLPGLLGIVTLAGSGLVLGPQQVASAASPIDVSQTEFEFGVDGQVFAGNFEKLDPGQFLDYEAVATVGAQVLDARVTFVRGDNLQGSTSGPTDPDRLRRLDRAPGDSDPGTEAFLDHSLARNPFLAVEVMAEVSVEFFLAGTSTPAVISGLAANFYDIDALQAVEVDGAQSYTLSQGNTHLTVTTTSAGALRFAEMNGVSTREDDGTAFTIGRAEVVFATTSAVTYRLIMLANSISTGASFNVDFAVRTWSVNTTQTPAPASISPPVGVVTSVENCPVSVTPFALAGFGGAVTSTVSAGTLPAGLSWDENTHVLSGSVSAATSASVSISATGATSGTATANLDIDIAAGPMTLSPATQVVTSTVNASVTSPPLVSGLSCGTPTFTVTPGLPAGLQLNATTGEISGTPTAAGTSSVVLTATDSIGRTATASATITINAAAAAVILPPPTETTPTTTPATTAAAPVPVPAPSGALPEVAAGESLVTENGQVVDAEVLVEGEEFLVLRGQDFELRLAGACTEGCRIAVDETGRETIHLERDGAARVSGFGFLPGSEVHIWVFSEPIYLGALLVAEDGTYAGTFDLTGIEVGSHTLQANGFSFDSVARSANLGIVVVDATSEVQPTTLPQAGAGSMMAAVALALLILGTAMVLRVRRRLV